MKKIIAFATMMMLSLCMAMAQDFEGRDSLGISMSQDSLKTMVKQEDSLYSSKFNFTPTWEMTFHDAKKEHKAALDERYGGYRPWREFEVSSVPLLTFGLISLANKEDYRTARNKMIPTFHSGVDNYLQYSPLAIVTVLNMAGLKGRSSRLRYLSSAATSVAIMEIIAQGLKYSVKTQRPDGDDRNSMPSGHTAIAFAGATILHKEYGLTRSPWYSVLGYGLATATGVMRCMNNRHWVSDVLIGAGIGILSTDIGYALMDLAWKNKGINRQRLDYLGDIRKTKNFLKFSLGMTLLNNLKLPKKGDFPTTLKVGMGTSISAEGAYFPLKYVGIGARARISTATVTAEDLGVSNASDVWSIGDIGAGVYGVYPFGKRHNIGAKLLYNRRFFSSLDLEGIDEETGLASDDKIGIEKTNTSDICFGVHYTYAMKEGVALSAYFDYDYARPQFNVNYTSYDMEQGQLVTTQQTYKQTVNSLSVGASMVVMF